MVTAPQNLEAGGANAKNVFPMDHLGADGRVIGDGGTPNVSAVNGQDGEDSLRKKAKARRFRPRHIQMMALGIFLPFSGLTSRIFHREWFLFPDRKNAIL
jgi:hypothetical protein